MVEVGIVGVALAGEDGGSCGRFLFFEEEFLKWRTHDEL